MALRIMVKITHLIGNFSVFLKKKQKVPKNQISKNWIFNTYMFLQNTKYLSSVIAVVV